MSCGNPHELDCSEVLNHLYEYLDNEMPAGECAKFKEHFDECSPCLELYGLEQLVKALVRRSCGCDAVPSDLRDKVLNRIRQIRAGEVAPQASPEPCGCGAESGEAEDATLEPASPPVARHRPS